LTIFLAIKKRDSFYGLSPLGPKELKITISKLGASFIKLAQVLATRSDFFNAQYLEELKTLHDNLQPMSTKEFKIVFESSFANKEIFTEFDEIAIASASIGQVHKATLRDGTKVAVKLRRHGIKQQVLADIKIITFFNKIFKPLFSQYTKNSIEAVITEFSKMIRQEISFKTELQNLISFSQTYKDSGINFPVAYEEFCSDSAIVMSFEEGFRFDDKENIFKHKIDFNKIIKNLVVFYTDQMLIKGFFHADPHPGNLLVKPSGELVLLDFGMVKKVPNDTRIAIIELIKAANEGDYELYVSANKRLGTIAYEAPTSELAEFSSKMFTIFSNNNLSSESMQKLAFEVLETTKDLPFKLPSDAIYILRVSAIIEGLGTTYIENFNGIKDILPILKEHIPKALGAQDSVIKSAIDVVKSLPFITNDFKNSIKKISEGEIKIELSNDQLNWIAKELRIFIKPIISSFAILIFAIFLVFYDNDLKDLSLMLAIFSIIKLFWKL
jgi:predicted unusual protein kinase regulating ubiquinone biosynthesis (AarF/ABC1/UbiB family)